MPDQNNKTKIGRRPFMIRSLAALGSLPLLSLQSKETEAKLFSKRFEFGVMGDMPYTVKQEAEYARLLEDMNGQKLSFVTHVGDMMSDPRPYDRNPASARKPCTDENYAYVLDTFRSVKHPLVMTPGDNDWADVTKFKNDKMDPIERLNKVRSMFYPKGQSLGQKPMAVNSQAENPSYSRFVENQSWNINGVQFATLHVIGSDDNASDKEEHGERLAANVAWLKKAFADARAANSPGLVLISHANPGFENRWTSSYRRRYAAGVKGMSAPKEVAGSAYDPFLDALIEEMQNYSKPVLYIHGDTHIFRVGKPLNNPKSKRFFENFTRLETFGSPDTNWVKVAVDPEDPELFTIHPEIVPSNSANY
jgi:predicted phosphodiesterase